ncbi:tail collar fiber protein [Erwinia phage Cronus]|uniref:Tail fibers protein n=1 Tax=Erwinia phage Cronus TaxID=2163633 RepID=A0A2S1GLP1_9CAUD|nr:tail collar fiber protein [Erwinia phage Cronus]AWD90308.1 tail fibers protein [Erwinia phage Cronus]
MSQNNLNHYSDLSKYKIFEPANTSWPEDVKDVQSALALIGDWARTDVGLPNATESVVGVSRLATQQEVNDGEIDDAIVTPKTLKVRLGNPVATTTVLGLTQYATNAEAAALTLDTRSITAASLGYVFNNVTANVSRFGTVKLTSSAQAQAGTDDTSATSPARVKEMIAKFAPVAPSYSTANETTLGLTRLSTIGQTQQGTLRDGFAVSPYSFVNSRANQTLVGTTRMATLSEVNAGNDTTIAVSPSTLMNARGAINKYGVVKLSNSYNGDGTTALASTAPVVYNNLQINGHPLTGNFNITSDDVWCWNRQQSDDRYLFKNQGGNWSRSYAANYVQGGNWMSYGTDVPVNTKMTIVISVKFQRNNDGETNRFFNFDVRVNGVTRFSDGINVYNSKGGKSGHSWRFEDYGTRHYETFDIPPGALIQIVPTNTYLVDYYGTSFTLSN